jgi:hypothetical protein
VSFYTGTVQRVVAERRQANVAEDAAAGASTLLLDDVGPFLEAGGQALVDGVLLDYLTVDSEAESMTLAAPLASLVSADSTVQAAQQGRGVLDWYVYVLLDGQEGLDDDPVPAALDHEQIGYLREGTADEGKRVTLSATARGLYLDEIDGGVPLLDGSTLDPEIPIPESVVPAVPPAPPPAPTATPVPEPLGVPGAILVQLEPIVVGDDPAVPAVVDVYVSTTSPVNITDPGTFHGTATAGSVYRIGAMPDGSELAYDVDYYIVVVARNAGGEAEPSTEVAGQMRQITGPDVSVNAVWAGWVAADRVTSGTTEAEIVLAGMLESRNPLGAEFGRVGISQADGIYSRGAVPAGGELEDAPVLVHFPTNGAPNIVSGIFEAEKMTVTGGATFRAATSLEPEATLTLEQGVQPPKAAPSVIETWHKVDIESQKPSTWETTGLTKGPDELWYVSRYHPGSSTDTQGVVESFQADGTFVASYPLTNNYLPVGGVVYHPVNNRYMLITQHRTTESWYVETWTTGFSLVKRVHYANNTSVTRGFVIGWDHVGNRLMTAGSYSDSDETYLNSATWSAAGDFVSTVAGWWTASDADMWDIVIGMVVRCQTEHGDRILVRRQARASAEGEDVRVLAVVGTGGQLSRVASEEFPNAANSRVHGACWVPGATAADGRLYTVTSGSGIYRYEGGRMMWTSGSDRFSFDYRWFDPETSRGITVTTAVGSPLISSTDYVFGPGDNGVGIAGPGIPAGTTILSVTTGTGNAAMSANATATGSGVAATLTSAQQETGPSPRAVLESKSKRAQALLTFASIPVGRGGVNDPKGIRVYWGRGDTDGATAMVREKTLANGVISYTFGPGTEEGGSPAPPFGVSTPARFKSAAIDSLGLPITDFQGDGYARADMLMPAGVYLPYSEAVAPKGWALCQGQQLHKDVVGPVLSARWGTGASSRHGAAATDYVMMPDWRGRVPIGAGTFAALGATDGKTEASRTLRHSHSTPNSVDSAGGHEHNASGITSGTAAHGGDNNTGGGGNLARITSIGGGNFSQGHNHSVTGNTGTAGGHNHALPDTNLSAANAIPYFGANWIVKL